MKEEAQGQPTPQRVVLDPHASDSEFKIQTVAAIVLQDHKIGSLERGQQKLTDLVTEGFEGVRAHQRKQDERLSGVGQVSGKTVFQSTIGLIGALQIVFGAAFGATVLYVGLKIFPVNEKVDKEIEDRKITDVVNGQQSQDIADLKAKWETTKMMAEHAREIQNIRSDHAKEIQELRSQQNTAVIDIYHQWFVREMDKADIQNQRDRLELLHHLESLVYDMSPAPE